MKKFYNKLVRDRIPEIIRDDKGIPKTRILSEEEFVIELFKKIKEEAEECKNIREDRKELIKEIGDIYEVIEAIIEKFGFEKNEITKIKAYRKKTRGGFQKRVFLESVER